MSDFDKKNQSPLTEESVDDILAGILNPDGSFNDEWGGMLARYSGMDAGSVTVPNVDISDRRNEAVSGSRVEFEAAEETHVSFSERDSADSRINEKLPVGMRQVYNDVSADAQRPEFTAAGGVKYPAMGIGASEQRVVYDADWEESAKQEAARRERVRQDRMLRGDSTYARNSLGGGMYVSQRNPYVDDHGENSLYIDPLSRDTDFEGARENSQYYSSTKKSFFPEGFSVVQKNNVASSGKTERMRGGSGLYSSEIAGKTSRSNAEWLQVDEKPKKKKGFGRKKKESQTQQTSPSTDSSINAPLQSDDAERTDEDTAVTQTVKPVYDREELLEVTQRTEGLRSTVAEIVDKYNKRSEEDARRILEEQTRQEEQRREEELRERKRLEELRLLKKQMSPHLCDAIDSENDDGDFDEYEDFSTEPVEKKEKKSKESFEVVFDPSAFSTGDYLEKLSGEETEETAVSDTKDDAPASEGKPSKRKKKRF